MKGSWQMEAFVFSEMPGRHKEKSRAKAHQETIYLKQFWPQGLVTWADIGVGCGLIGAGCEQGKQIHPQTKSSWGGDEGLQGGGWWSEPHLWLSGYKIPILRTWFSESSPFTLTQIPLSCLSWYLQCPWVMPPKKRRLEVHTSVWSSTEHQQSFSPNLTLIS